MSERAKNRNLLHSHFRSPAEHSVGYIKRFQIASAKYRGRMKGANAMRLFKVITVCAIFEPVDTAPPNQPFLFSPQVLAQVSNMINATRMRVSVGENLMNIMAEETDDETASGAETDATAVADSEDDWQSDGVLDTDEEEAALDALMLHIVNN